MLAHISNLNIVFTYSTHSMHTVDCEMHRIYIFLFYLVHLPKGFDKVASTADGSLLDGAELDK